MRAVEYHDATKHHFQSFARSLGYLDWASQPDPFRRYAGAPFAELPRDCELPATSYSSLYGPAGEPAPLDEGSVALLLRCSMGLSAWKQYGTSRWALRVNPSSGNLHPTETYIVWQGRVSHYAPREHALEHRCDARGLLPPEYDETLLVALTSIHWREAWKYGERAFRYCQHDAGHAIAALRLAAAMLGWRLELLDGWPHDSMAALLGLDRDDDFEDAEREEPECVAVVTTGRTAAWQPPDPRRLVEGVGRGSWSGRANRLSSTHLVDWPIIDAVARATRLQAAETPPHGSAPAALPEAADAGGGSGGPSAAEVFLRRRSALGFNPRGALRRDTFLSMLSRVRPPAPPFDAIDWPPQVHLALFVHRVLDVTPGIYVSLRDAGGLDELKAALRPDFLWEPAAEGLFLLAPVDVRGTANRLSCDQDIAEDGFFSLAMLARFERTLRERGEWFYRRLFWECGMVGQVLYLEAEAAGARSTGIGCFYDDPVHEVLGLTGHAWQSLYHFSMGVPVDDGRLTTEPGYPWEGR